ncbi:MAG: tRNA dihydrouridine synthase DusB [Candidatus Promineifilaceae bacterium]|nr:tRNA dihydrouridine synthase DusB [Candidatus Promineifilaceae bacterium]
MKETPRFWVRDVPVYGDVILAPMAGFSDVPYRSVCGEHGSAMHYTEFVPVEALLGKQVDNRFWQRLDKNEGEHPLVFQIFGNNARKILEAAMRIETLGPDIIDINMGCSTRKVSGRGAGAGMMPRPELVAETFQLLSSHLRVPVTGKIRLGWDDDQRNYAEIAKIMVDNGASLIAMHARTKAQKYGGQADWDEIARLRQKVDVPVIGNGDISSVEDISKMIAHTGCDAVMVGRAARGNPWIFERRSKTEVTRTDFLSTIRMHLNRMVDYYGERLGLRQFRKHFKHYINGVPVTETLSWQMVREDRLEDFLLLLAELDNTDHRSFSNNLLISPSKELSIEY